MSERILVTGKKISSMELVTNVTGNEKIPTGQPDDLAITPNQISDYAISRGNLVSRGDLSQVESDLSIQIADLASDVTYNDNSVRGLIAAEEDARIAADNLKVDKEGSVSSVAGRVGDVVLAPSDVLVEGFGSQEEVNKYVAKPFLSGYTYGLGERVVLNDGEVVKSLVNGNVGNPNVDMAGWVSAVSDSLSDTIQTFNTPEAGVDPVTGVAEGAYFNVRSSSDESYVGEYRNVGGVPTPTGKSHPSGSYVETIAEHTALPFKQGKTYGLHERVKLDNGDIVKSTIDGNTDDPNVNMTGWVKTNSASQIKYNNSYSVEASLYYLTPEMFGAVGDGVTDDYQAIQTMLNVGAAGCTFEFDGSKTYYNAFVIDEPAVFVDHKNGSSNSKQWTRSLGATFKFNGARLTRRAPTGDIEDIPYKTKYSDNDSASLLIKDATKIIICDPYIDCGGDKRGFVDLNSDPIADSTDYYGADVGVYGLRLWSCSDIELRNVHAEKGYFNVFLDTCTDVRGDITSKYAVQCPIRSYAPTDLNFGGAVKVWFCKNVDLNIRGAYNANATAEVEKGNYNVRITGSSKNDWSNSVVIQDTQVVTIDWSAEDVKSGTGVFIKRTGEEATPNLNNIKGRIHAKNCYWRGVMIENANGTTGDLYGVQLDIVTENCGDGGLYIRNDSTTSVIDGININHFSKDDDGTNKARCLIGRMRGMISGNQTGTDYGVIVQGTNTASTCITLSIDASNCITPYDIASTAFVNFKEFVTSTDVITAFAGKNMQLGTTTNKGNYVNKGEIRLNHFSVKVTSQYNVFENLASASGNEKLRLWYDSTAGVAVTGGMNYPIKVFVPTP